MAEAGAIGYGDRCGRIVLQTEEMNVKVGPEFVGR
jgi:hypothetical protein